jgi:hypothetical protein
MLVVVRRQPSTCMWICCWIEMIASWSSTVRPKSTKQDGVKQAETMARCPRALLDHVQRE